MLRAIKKGATDQSVVIRIIDSADGTPETAVEHNTSGIDLWYRREGATKTSITEAALAALDSAHADGGIEHIGDGYYRLDLPDAAVASGANGVMVGGVVTGMVVIGCYIPLVDYDPQDTVRLGLTALPNAAADAAGGLPISDAGGLDLDAIKAKTDQLAFGTANRVNAQVYGMENSVVTAAAVATDAIDADALAANGITEIVAGIWNALLSDYNTVQTFGQALNGLRARGGEVNDAGGTSTVFIVDGFTEATDDHFNNMVIVFTSGALTGQARRIADYTGATQTVTVSPALTEAPANNDDFIIVPASMLYAALVSEIDAVQADIAALNNLSAAQVNAEADQALSDYGALKPTTAGRTLDVTATGAAGIDWNNIENPTTAVDLSGTTVKTATDVETDTQNIQSRLPAALSGGKMDSVADVTAISGDTTAADRLEAALDGTVTGSVNDAGATTTAFITDLSSAVNDYYNGRILTFTSGALAGQQREITDYVGATKTVTVAALTSAPANGVTFVVT